MSEDPLGLTPAQRLESEIEAIVQEWRAYFNFRPPSPPTPMYRSEGCGVYEGERLMATAVTEEDAQFIAVQLNLESD